jgi:hypothetical protein
MPNPTNGLSPLPPTDPSAETPMEALSPSDLNEKLAKSERLGFLEQARVVREGFRKGVKYDGCTAVPDFDFGADCCGEHDAHYQLGDLSRREADRRLRDCIRKKGYFALPWAYWLGVRLFAGGVWKKYRRENDNRNKNEETNGGDGNPAA